MKTFEAKILINASPAGIFRLYSDVEGWKNWDPEVEWSKLDGAFVAGSHGKLKPPKAPAAAIRLVDVQDSQSFTVESKLPLCRVIFEHELVPKGISTEVQHRVSFSGLLSPLFAYLIGRKIDAGFPSTLAGLKEIAEGSA
jgi:Polyketide cyclase / dehydrase and lipid transport